MTRHTLLWSLGLCLAVVATNRYDAAPLTREFVPGDAYAYFTIAQSAPALPNEPILFHHGQRLALPYLLGLIHLGTSVPLHRLFQLSVVLLALAALLLLAGLLERLSIHRRQAALILTLVAFNPWAFRPYLTYPEMVNDLGFVFGLAIVLRGLFLGHGRAVLLGQLVASLSRQTGLLLLPLVAVWLWRDRGVWGQVAARTRVAIIGAAAVAAAVVYVATARLAALFSGPDENLEHLLGMWDWLLSGFDARVLVGFLIRALMLPLIPLALFIATRGLPRRHGPGSAAVPLLLFGTVCIWSQPWLAGPDVTGGNAQRLMALGLLPFCLALAITCRDRNVFTGATGRGRLCVIGLLVALGSVHHLYVLAADPAVWHKIVFGVSYALACAGCFAVAALEARGSAAGRR